MKSLFRHPVEAQQKQNPQCVTAISVWDISSTYKREASSIIHTSGNTHSTCFSSRINILALPGSAYLFSVPPLGGHFVYINHTVTLRIPKMASASASSTWAGITPTSRRVPCLLLKNSEPLNKLLSIDAEAAAWQEGVKMCPNWYF